MTTVDLPPPLPGPHAPVTAVPARRPDSVRRTSTIDVVRPEGLLGPVTIDARARDLVTGPDGEVRATTAQTLTADVTVQRCVAALRAEPDEPALVPLVGASLARGFRRAALEAVPHHVRDMTLLHLLLDDLPGAALVGGFSFGHAAQSDATLRALMLSQGPIAGTPDLCAGWVEGGGIMTFLRREQIPPVLTGPPVPPSTAEDPLAWHERADLTPHCVRRARMLDVWRADGAVRAHSSFRDSHVDADGRETVVHEYTVEAGVEDDGVVGSCVATVRVLPWAECPQAAASAERIVGVSVGEVRELVRRTFTGITTCTHLNDQLRSLADIPALAAVLD